MIGFSDLYNVLSAVVPLYFTMFLAYGSVKYAKIFTPDQCSGINRFVAIFAVPLLSFEFISRIDPYGMDLLFISADAVSKLLVLILLLLWAKLSSRGNLDWVITLFCLSTLPNTLVLGIPLLKSMYGDDKEGLMIQAVVLQCIIWYTLLLFLFEYRAARVLVLETLNDAAAATAAAVTDSELQLFEDKLGTPNVGEEEVIHVLVTAGPLSSELSDADKLQNCNNKVAPASGKLRPTTQEDGSYEQPTQQVCSGDHEEMDGEERERNYQEKQVTKIEELIPYTSSHMVKLIMKMVGYRLVRNPNSYASLLGLGWALVSSKWGIKKPLILENSVTILSNAGLGMAMFSLGLFMALQPRIIACGTRLAAYGMVARFLAGPAVMSIASLAVGLRGTVLRVSIVQAALPQGIVPFVFAREYNVHPDVLSTAVIFGMIVSLPISMVYYILLGL